MKKLIARLKEKFSSFFAPEEKVVEPIFLSSRRTLTSLFMGFVIASFLITLDSAGLSLLDALPSDSAFHSVFRVLLWGMNTTLIVMLGAILVPLFLKMRVPLYIADGYSTFRIGARNMIVVALFSLILFWLTDNFIGAIFEKERRIIVKSFGVIVLWCGVLLLTFRQIQWLDMFMRLRRTKYTLKLRAVIIGVTLGMVGFDLVVGLPEALRLVGIIVVIFSFIFSVSKISWIVTFPKEQKKSAFNHSMLALFVNALAISKLDSFQQTYSQLGGIFDALVIIPLITFTLATVFYLRIAIYLSLTLPAASIIDKKIKEVNSLSYVSGLMSKMSEFQELLDSITRLVGQVSGATSSLIIIQDDGEGERRRAYFNLTSKGVASIVANKDFFKMIERAEKPIFIENVLELPEHEHYNDIMPFIGKSLIAVPLIIEGERMGTLLAMHHDEFAFEPEDVSLLFAFANNITIAIDNARLYKKSLQQERYQRELRLAQDIQRRLLPESLPKVQQFDLAAYSSPAFEVGGDYYEAVELKNGNICLLVGDVSGKGISAALYMSVVKGIVLAIARESNSPKELLERINEAIFGEIDRQSYITAIALEIDPHRCSLRLARAGHTPLLLRRNDHVELLTPKGLGIGLMSASFFNSVLEEVEVEFGEDDACLLFSDGINEAVNARGEEFGLEAMKSIIALKTESAEMLLGNVLRSIIDFAKDTPQHDDITMVAVTCQKKQPPIS